MTVARPTRIKVGHMIVTVDWIKDSDWLKSPDLDDGDAGQWLHKTCTISMRDDKDNHLFNEQEVLLHEVMHAAWSVAGLSYDDLRKVDDIEETAIMRVAPSLLMILKDNPDLLAYLTSA